MKTIKHFLLKYRTLLSIIILAGIASAIYAQVDEDELSGLPPVVFLNYEGPHTRIDTREEIRQIGVVLGQRISSAEGSLSDTLAAMSAEQRRYYSYIIEAGATNRYFVIHCVSGPEDDKIDADIFVLGVDAGVDHIRNLRTIVQGYLQAAYGYSERDAALLAEYITVYNAVYRGNWDYFVGRYKTQVINNLIRDRAGLSIRYDEWPGRTMLLIPLGHGGLSSVDTSTISDSRVLEELRREDDQGVQQRRDMVDLKEREAEQADSRAQTEREVVRQTESDIARDRDQVAQERQDIERERQEDQTGAAQEDLNRREQAADDADDELARREEENERRRQEAQRLADLAAQKTDEAQQGRQDIAEDQQAAIAEDTTGGYIGIMIEGSDSSIGRLVRISTTSGRVLARSPLDTVHVRTVTIISGRILAIAGENKGNGAVRLIEANPNSLEMARQGDDDIKEGSLLWVNGNDLYAITIDLKTDSCYLGRFNTNLAIQAKSANKVHPDASITIQQGYLLTQNEDGSVLILNPDNLTEMRQ